MKPLKILHCIHSLRSGGAETQLRLLTEASAAHGMIAGIACVQGSPTDIDDPSVAVFSSQTPARCKWRLFSHLNSAIKDFQPDIVHVWLPASMTIPAMVVARFHKIPCVYSYRNAMHFHRPLAIPEFLIALATAYRIVSNNDISLSSWYYQWLYRLKSGQIIPNAVSVGNWACARQNPNSLHIPLRMLFVGRLTPQKNWRCLLMALRIVARSNPVELSVCGDGEDYLQFLSITQELQLVGNVTLLGFRNDIYKIMSEADLLILPSWYEGMPNVLLEALAIGLPCIVSDIQAHRAILQDSGCALMFPPSSPESLAAKILEHINRPQQLLTHIALGQTIARSYSVHKMAEQYQLLYQQIVRDFY